MKKKLLFVLWLMSSVGQIKAQDFETVWRTYVPGSGPGTLHIGVVTSGTCSYTWETIPAGQSGSGTFSGNMLSIGGLPLADIRLKISPVNFRQIRMANGPDRNRLHHILKWGAVQWTGMDSAFAGCSELFYFPVDTPDLSIVEDMSYMFYKCSFQGLYPWSAANNATAGWNTSSVKNMRGVFMASWPYFPNVGTWDVSNVTDMSFMFFDAQGQNLNVGNWNVGKVTNMESMFESVLTSVYGIGNWDVSNVTNMRKMFRDVFSSVGQSAYFSSPDPWDVSNVTDMSFMFANTTVSHPIGNWDVSHVTNMEYMFNGTKHFNQPLDNWNVSQVTNMRGMFAGTGKFNQPLNSWDVSSVTDMSYMFYCADSFNYPIGSWDVSQVTNMEMMFGHFGPLGKWNVFNQPLDNWNVSQVVGMNSMFHRSYFNQNLGNWVFNPLVSTVGWISSSSMDCYNYTQSLMQWAANPDQFNGVALDVNWLEYGLLASPARNYLLTSKGWNLTGDVQSVYPCTDGAFNTRWNMDSSGLAPGQLSFEAQTNGSCTYSIYHGNQKVQGTFTGPMVTLTGLPASGEVILSIRGDSLQQVRMGATADRSRLLELGAWGPAQWTGFDSAFAGCVNLNVTASDTPRLANVNSMEAMFDSCVNLHGNVSFNTWHTATVSNMARTFRNAKLFNMHLHNWSTGSVYTMQQMFKGAAAFDKVLFYWNTVNVEDMGEMFSGATKFNQLLSNWNTGKVKYMGAMFQNCTAFNQPIGQWDVSQVINMQGMLKGATAFNQPLQQWVFHPSVNTANFLQNTGMTCYTYDSCLRAWASQNQAAGIYLDAQRPYGNGGWPSRDSLKNQKGWVFNDYWQNCTPLEAGSLAEIEFHIGSFYPNPAEQLTFLDIESPAAGKLSWQISDLLGRVWLRQEQELQAGTNHITIPLQALAPGLYTVALEWQRKRVVRRLEVGR